MNNEEEINNQIPIDDETPDHETDLFDDETDYDEIIKNRERLSEIYNSLQHLQDNNIIETVIRIIKDNKIRSEIDFSDHREAVKLMLQLFNDLGYDQVESYFKENRLDELIDKIKMLMLEKDLEHEMKIMKEYQNELNRKFVEKQTKLLDLTLKEFKYEHKSSSKKLDPEAMIKYIQSNVRNEEFAIKIVKLIQSNIGYAHKYKQADLKAKSTLRKSSFFKRLNFMEFVKYYKNEKELNVYNHKSIIDNYEEKHKCTRAVLKFYNVHKTKIVKIIPTADSLKNFLSSDINKIQEFINTIQ